MAAHELALSFGGRAGIRDQGSIEAAIARPYNGYYRSIAHKAAALVHSLALNHGFIDGNKRTALYLVNLLILRSGYAFNVSDRRRLETDMENMLLALVDHRMTFDELLAWFKQRIISQRR